MQNPSPARPAVAATDASTSPAPSAALVTLVGAFSMATAMGIGRFAFTPLLPLMQQHQGLSLAHGTWLATVNYVGYLVGSILGMVRPVAPGRSARWGLVAVALTTLAMAFTHDLAAWLMLRFVAGIGSALVLFGVSGWALAQLGLMKRGPLAGWVFSGVGIGIASAGGIAYFVGTASGDPVPAWTTLGIVAVLILIATWRPYLRDLHATTDLSRTAAPLGRSAWVLTVCYGMMGFGYIVPATFLPAVARALVNDPSIFGWVWPVFGIAAALSTGLMATAFARVPPRTICAGAMLVMAIGVGAPVVHLSLATLILSATCVGGTFVVVTLAGIQEARRLVPGSPARLIAGMTTLFAIGQLAAPLLAHAGSSAITAMRTPSTIASLALFASAAVLFLDRPTR